jgi:transposase-like protein
LFLDAKIEKVRDGGRVVDAASVIAHGMHETGRREIHSIDVGGAATEAFWTSFLRGLVTRGVIAVCWRCPMPMRAKGPGSPRSSAAPGSASRFISSETA